MNNMEGLTFDEVGDEKREYLHIILENTTYDDKQKDYYRIVINELVYWNEFELMLSLLMMNEIKDSERIPYGFNYNQSDIKKHLKRKL
jgi:hypothetical protein